jgi:hypothetical protein
VGQSNRIWCGHTGVTQEGRGNGNLGSGGQGLTQSVHRPRAPCLTRSHPFLQPGASSSLPPPFSTRSPFPLILLLIPERPPPTPNSFIISLSLTHLQLPRLLRLLLKGRRCEEGRRQAQQGDEEEGQHLHTVCLWLLSLLVVGCGCQSGGSRDRVERGQTHTLTTRSQPCMLLVVSVPFGWEATPCPISAPIQVIVLSGGGLVCEKRGHRELLMLLVCVPWWWF